MQKIQTELKEQGLVYLKIKVVPKAAQTEIREIMADDTLKIAVKAPPTDGKANSVLVKFLKETFQAEEVLVISGKTERIKLVKIIGKQ